MKRSVALLVAACFFMENLDGTVVTTAIPRIADDPHVTPNAVGIVITAYLVSLAVFIPVGGWLMTRFTARTIFGVAIALFTLTSLACGFTSNLTALVVLRTLQGIGGALMVPVGRQVVFRDAPKHEMLRWMSYIVWPGLVAPVLAPLLGGVITTCLSWQWIFWLNVPLGITAFLAALHLIPASTDDPPRTLDWLGFLLVGGGLGGLTWSAHLIADHAASMITALVWLTAAVVLCALAGWHVTRARNPLIDTSVLHDRTFGISQAAVVGFWILVASVPFLMPLMMQIAFGWSPVRSGAVVMFVFVGNIAIKPVTTPLLSRCGFRPVLIASTVGLTASTLGIGLCTAHLPIAVTATLALVSGIFRSTALSAFATVGFATIDTAQRPAANTLMSVIQQVCSGLGIAVATIALSIGQAITSAPHSHSSFMWAFALMAVVGVAPAALVWLLPHNAGAELRPVSVRADRSPTADH